MKCPTCGRFARVVRWVNDSAPMSAEQSYFAVVNCKVHGLGENT